MVSFSKTSPSTSASASSSSVVGRYRAVVLFLIILQAMTMWTTTSVKKRQQDQIQHPVSFTEGSINSKQDFLMRSKQRRIAKRLSSSSSPPTNVPPQCMELMQKFHDLNERYRYGDESVTSKPLINYAYYKSQGFGRLVDHSTAHCILALAMDRPCAIDFTDRDPYYTWRHFIYTGTYDWEMTGPNAEFLPEVSRAISEMSDIGAGEWKEEHIVNSTYDKILLMQTPPAGWPAKPQRTLPRDFERHMHAWGNIGRAGEKKNNNNGKALLSPNWGNAWFPQLQFPEEIQGCNKMQLHALMQNALYQPTPLALKLHHERMVQTFAAPPPPPPPPSEVEAETESTRRATKKAAPKEKNFIVNQQQRTLEKQEPYGAIHIRTVILKSSINGGEERLQNLTEPLLQCLHHVRSELLAKNKRNDITKWWILSDKPPVAVDLVQNITDFRLFHAYHLDDGFHDNNAHSALPAARGVFAHTNMAPSIADWLVLHQSDIAIVTHGSFGDTGARGKGKYPRKGMADKCDFFEVFF